METRTVEARLRANTAQYDAAVAKSRAETERFGRVLDAQGKGMRAHGEQLRSVGGAMTVGVTAPLLAMGGAAIAAAKDFNAGMANVGTLIPGNTARVKELKDEVQAMAVATGKSTSDLSAGLYQVVSAFGDSADAAAILEVNARAARGGLAETTDAINLTSAVTKSYGDVSAEAVTRSADLALMTVRLGQTTFPELAASIGTVTPLAAELNVTQQELFGTMATFTGVTGSASEVSTQLRGVLQSLLAPTGNMAGLLADMGFESGEAMVAQLGLQGTIAAVVKAAEGAGAPLQSFISSIEGQTLALSATGGQADAYRGKVTAMGDAAGTTGVAFAESTEGINATGFAAEQAAAKAEVFRQELGDALAPAMNAALDAADPLLDRLAELARQFAELDEGTQTIALGGLGLVAAAGPVSLAAGGIVSAVGGVTTGFQQLREKVQTARLQMALGRMEGVSYGRVIASQLNPGALGVTAALGLGVTALALWTQQKAEARRRAEQFAATLDEETGALTDNSYEHVRNRLAMGDAFDNAEKLGISHGDLVDAILGEEDALARVRAAIDKYLVVQDTQRGGWDEQTLAAHNLNGELADQITVVSDATEAGRDKARADAESTVAAKKNAAATGKQADVMSDAERAARDLKSSIDDLVRGTLSAQRAAITYESSIDDLRKTLRDNGNSLDINTKKGRENKTAVLEGAQAIHDHVDALAEEGASMRRMRNVYDDHREDLRNVLTAAGFTRREVENLIDVYKLTPEDVETKIRVHGAQAAKAGIDDIQSGLDSLGTTVKNIGGEMRVKVSGGWSAGIERAAGGPVPGRRTHRDTVPAVLTPGEFVQREAAVDYYGVPFMDALNRMQVPREALGGYNAGGMVGSLTAQLSAAVTGMETMPPWSAAGGDALDKVRAAMRGLAGLSITSTYRTPARNAAVGGSPTSYHLDRDDPATDVVGPASQLDALYERLAQSRYRELLWRVLGHFDHLHYAKKGGLVPVRSYDRGGYLQPGWTLAHNGTGAPEPVGYQRGGLVTSGVPQPDRVRNIVDRAVNRGTSNALLRAIEQVEALEGAWLKVAAAHDEADRRADLVAAREQARAERSRARRRLARAEPGEVRDAARELRDVERRLDDAREAIDEFDRDARVARRESRIADRLERVRDRAEALAERERARADAEAERNRNRREWEFERAGAQRQLRILDRRIEHERRFTDEWMNLTRQRAQLRDETNQEERAASDELRQKLRARADEMAGFARINEEATVGFGIPVTALLGNVNSQVEQFTDWMVELKRARRRGVSEQVIELLGLDAGPQTLAQLRAFSEASREEIDELNDAVAERNRVAGEQAASELAGGIRKGTPKVRRAIAELQVAALFRQYGVRPGRNSTGETARERVERIADAIVEGRRSRADVERSIRRIARTYDVGGVLEPGWTLAFNGTGRDEYVHTAPLTPVGQTVTEHHTYYQVTAPGAYAEPITEDGLVTVLRRLEALHA